MKPPDTFCRNTATNIQVDMMNLNSTTQRDFTAALRQQRERSHSSLPDTPDLQQWLHYWNDEENFATNMRNLAHWINCAKNQTA